MLRQSRFITLAAIAALTVFSRVPPATAGCGCQKAPPDIAAIRPNAAYSGSPVTLFHPDLEAGRSYSVVFTAGQQSVTVPATAGNRRDLADRVYKPQLVLPLPPLPLGPAAVRVVDPASGSDLLSLTDDALTVIPRPVSMPSVPGTYRVPRFQAAVGRDGTLYMSLDMSRIHNPRTFQAQAKGYPLAFTSDDVSFYNAQGFLMQLLGQNMPGLFSIGAPATSRDSNILGYSRHEFNTWFLQHGERQQHQLDPSDPNWHLDGSPHIDHDHLVIAVAGVFSDGSTPPPGATPPFELVLQIFTFFEHGIVGTEAVALDSKSLSDSYDSRTDLRGSSGDVYSNGTIFVDGGAQVKGDVAAATLNLDGSAKVTGAKRSVTTPEEFLPVSIPDRLTDLGSIRMLTKKDRMTIGPGSYTVTDVYLDGEAMLLIDNADGPVTLYVKGTVSVTGGAAILTADSDPEKFAAYVSSGQNVMVKNTGDFHGLVYAPASYVQVNSKGEFFGAAVGSVVELVSEGRFHYDTALRGDAPATSAALVSEPPPTPAPPTSGIDALTIKSVKYNVKKGTLSLQVKSTAAPAAVLRAKIAGVFSVTMTVDRDSYRYEGIINTDINNRVVIVTSDHGGSASATVVGK